MDMLEIKNRYAVVVGVGDYRRDDTKVDLPFAIRDARAVARLLRDPKIGQFPELNVTLILDGDSQLIQTKLEMTFTKAEQYDLVVVYFSCHGEKVAGKLHLLTRNSTPGRYMSKSISQGFLHDLMEMTRSQSQVVILDCCSSGAFGKDFKGEETISLDDLSGSGRYLLAATSPADPALPDKEREYSLFSHHLIEGIKTGEADADADGLITVQDLYEYVYPRVYEESHRQQKPMRWISDQAGELWVAKSQRARNPLITEIKLNPHLASEIKKDWDSDEFLIKEGSTPSGKLIPTPILTRKELDECYVPSSCIKKLRQEITASNRKVVWLFVSPQGTGKTSLITYLSAGVAGAKPKTKIIKVTRVPDETTVDRFINVLDYYHEAKPGEYIAVFDGNVLEPGCARLVYQIAESEFQIPVWMTCAPEEHKKLLDEEPKLKQYLEVKDVPGYVDANKEFFHSFVFSKFVDIMPDEHKKEQLKRTNVSMRSLCFAYVARAEGALPETMSERDKVAQQFYSMPVQAQLLARVLDRFGSLPEKVVDLLAEHTNLFRYEHYQPILDRGFAFESGESGRSFKPGPLMDQVANAGLADHEQMTVTDALLDLAEDEEDRVTLTLLLEAMKPLSEEFDEKRKSRYQQLVRRTEGGLLCNVCGKYYPKKREWCPICGRQTNIDEKVPDDVRARVLGDGLDSVPFPQTEFCSDVGRAEFVWSQLDLSTFDDLDKG